MKRPVVVGIGELLWDVLPDGKALGGAPANFAYIAHVLGANARLVTCVGHDRDGDQALQLLEKAGVATEYCQRSDFPTGSAGVSLREGQPCFTIAEDAAWDHIRCNDKTRALMRSADAVCFGSLAQRNAFSRAAIQECVAATSKDCRRIFDCNLRQSYYSRESLADSLRLATIAKVNDAELPTLTTLVECGGSPEELRAAFDLDLVCVTRGEDGCLLSSRERTIAHPGFATEMVDAIGAGDAFAAAMTHGLLQGWRLERVAALANSWGAFIASRRGAMPAITAEEVAAISRRSP